MTTNATGTVATYSETSPKIPNFLPRNQQKNAYKELPFIVVVLTIVDPMDLSDYFERACTGTLIRNDLVLTLASCLLIEYYDNPDPENTKVYERPIGNPLEALKVFVNPNYYSEDVSQSRAYDFAVILIEKSKQVTYPPIPLSMENLMEIKYTCLIAGYGNFSRVSLLNFAILHLKDLAIEEVKGQLCSVATTICLHFFSVMPCIPDAGAPMICHGVLYAIYAPLKNRISADCDNIYAATFLPVFKINGWLESIIYAPASKLEWLSNPFYLILLCFCVFTIMGTIYYSLVEILQWSADPADGVATLSSEIQEEENIDDDTSYDIHHQTTLSAN